MLPFISLLESAPLGKTHIFWVGQAGFIIKTSAGKLIGIDLYLSECVEFVEGHTGYHRLMPFIVEPSELKLDIIICSHSHRDHFDIDAVPQLMQNPTAKLFCAYDCQQDVEDLHIDKSRTTFVKPGDIYLLGSIKLSFIHSDHGTGAPQETAVIVSVDGRNICETGDTSLHTGWKKEYLKEGPLDVLIAPINGAYGNLDEQGNVTLVKALKPKLTVPCHFGMFASHGGNPGLWKELLDKQVPDQKYKIFTQGEGIAL